MTFVIVMGFHQIIVVMNDVKQHTHCTVGHVQTLLGGNSAFDLHYCNFYPIHTLLTSLFQYSIVMTPKNYAFRKNFPFRGLILSYRAKNIDFLKPKLQC